MHPRYPAPKAARVFSDEARIDRWFGLTTYFMSQQLHAAPMSDEERGFGIDDIARLRCPAPATVRTREAHYGHDVVAFLSLIEDQLQGSVALTFLHRGLTSSDLVENAHHSLMMEHLILMRAEIEYLEVAISLTVEHHLPRAGRTHGQVADVTSWNHQMRVHRHTLARILTDLQDLFNAGVQFKTVGPTGNSRIGPNVHHNRRSLSQPVPSTQVIPRDWQLKWASLYLRLACELESLAVLIRCGARADVGELAEGASRVGSSSMSTKKNPIDSEKVCGLARVARGHFMTLAEGVALWDDRDISNSSAERIAVPDLAATVEHMTITMREVMSNLVIDAEKMRKGTHDPRTRMYYLQAMAQKHFAMGPVAAGDLVRRYCADSGYINTPAMTQDNWDIDAVHRWLDEVNHAWSDAAEPPASETD